MAVTGTAKTPRDASVTVSDGTGAPISLALIRDMGDFQWVRNEKSVVVMKTRGSRNGIRDGEDPDTDANGSWSEQFGAFTDTTDGTSYDLAAIDGKFASAVTTATAGGGYDVGFVLYDILYTLEGTDMGDPTDHTVTFSDCRILMSGYTEAWPITASYAFECYGGVVVTGES